MKQISLIETVACAALLSLAGPGSALVLCIGADDTVKARETCKLDERKVDPTDLGLQGLSRPEELLRSRFVNTISDLRDLPTPSGQISVNVLGYYVAGDGGGGTFYWDGEASLSHDLDDFPDGEDGGTVVKPKALKTSDPGRWRRVYDRNFVSVLWFGATGDDKTDDTPSLQDAINVLNLTGARKGGVVLFPPGRYHAKGLTIPTEVQGLTLKGAARSEDPEAGSWLVHTGKNTPLIKPTGDAALSYFTVEDLSFDQSKDATGHIFDITHRVNWLRFDRLYFKLGHSGASFLNLEATSIAHVRIDDVRGFMASGSVKPAFRIVAKDPGNMFAVSMSNHMINSNSAAQEGAFIYDFESRTSAASMGPHMRDITLEVPRAGGIRLRSLQGTILENVASGDCGPAQGCDLIQPVIHFENSEYVWRSKSPPHCCNLNRSRSAVIIGGFIVNEGTGPHVPGTSYPGVSTVDWTQPDLDGCPGDCPDVPMPDPHGLVLIGTNLNHLDTGSNSATLVGESRIGSIYSSGSRAGNGGAVWLSEGFLNRQRKGQATLIAGRATVRLLPEPSGADYDVTVSSLGNEQLHVTKYPDHFTITSSLPNSSATVYWILTKE